MPARRPYYGTMTPVILNRQIDLRRRAWCVVVGVVLALALAASSLHADPSESASNQRVPDDRVFAAFADGDYHRAASFIETILVHEPRNVMMLYNGACAASRLGRLEEAGSYLMRAIEAGFRDFEHLRTDPDLAAMHGQDVFEAILEAAERVKDHLPRPPAVERADPIDDWRRTFGEAAYRFDRDEKRGLSYAIALDDVSFAEMRGMLEQQADFLMRVLFQTAAAYEVLIAVPTPPHARELLGEDRVGGMYEHSRRRLVARNIGGSLRHEFFHLTHYRNMEVLGQLHTLWVQEGLAALFEDFHIDGPEQITFLPNERHNRVKALAQAGKLEKWSSLFRLSDEQFMRRATDLYPQVRSIFEFVADRGLLARWYEAYVQEFDADSSGVRAFEKTFGSTITDIERQWRLWLAKRPMIDNQVDFGDASLGVRVRPMASNDGVVVEEVLPGSGAAAAGLRADDVIVAIDRKATRSELELQAAIAERQIGQVVQVRIRREAEYLNLVVTLRAFRPR